MTTAFILAAIVATASLVRCKTLGDKLSGCRSTMAMIKNENETLRIRVDCLERDNRIMSLEKLFHLECLVGGKIAEGPPRSGSIAQPKR